jgi:hypothetical protein
MVTLTEGGGTARKGGYHSVCRSTNVTYRLDTASARQFLRPYVTLP